ncbi:protein phosphatase [Silvibacterium bohemicum]|uniref:Protein phosphatase n=1 Tax=Silvibacterium bohemicum TaxID=1577686 RepID=A0A841JMI5_9BACT|nr:PP2C family serine/threonine-protein phosphatase [Silvibacterium bohemicum]MBB6142566.1 protein phosphatase [Silvibacterium bohemicum]
MTGYPPGSPHQQRTAHVAVRIESAGLSDVGRKRSNNEDSFGFDEETNIFVVCDGMGGMAAGEVASALAVEHTLRTYKELYSVDMEPEKRLQAAIANANSAVWQMAQDNQKLRGMGTTLVAACVDSNHVVIGNVGDSRAYFLRDNVCIQITEDHSYRAEQLRRGAQISSVSPLQQFITRAIGVGAVVTPDFFAADLQPGDAVLLATDGLTRYMAPDEIASKVHPDIPLEDTCRELIAVAHQGGAEDNVTCFFVRVL